MKSLVLAVALGCLVLPAICLGSIVNVDVVLEERIAFCWEVGEKLTRSTFEDGLSKGETLKDMLVSALKTNSPMCGVLAESQDYQFSQEEILQTMLTIGIAADSLIKAAIDAGFDPLLVARVVGAEKLEGLGYAKGVYSTGSNPNGIVRGGTVSPSSL
ncbi:MAG: hypothetical protein C0616_04890 [Desulfuromonas sp.]|nr:MAG: hypothetical protein C0616_04890 [Desulfuromonas sp.]